MVCLMSIEGGIGVGKSTVMAVVKHALKGRTDVEFVDEPVQLWEEAGLLRDMYSGALNAGTFQHCALMSRMAHLLRAASNPNVRLLVTERSHVSDREVFARQTLSPAELRAYELTYAELAKTLPRELAIGFVHLTCSPEQQIERVRLRNRTSETSEGAKVDIAYLHALEERHAAFLNAPGTLKRTVDASESRGRVADAALAAVREVMQELGVGEPAS